MKESVWNQNINKHIDRRERSNILRLFQDYPQYNVSVNVSKKLYHTFSDIYYDFRHRISGLIPEEQEEVEEVCEDVAPFEVQVARKFVGKYNNAAKRGLEFDLTMQSIRNLLKAKKCFFTGLPLDHETRTVDRVDSTKGYIKGNVVACHKQVNQFKELIEAKRFDIGFEEVYSMMTKWKQHQEKSND